MFAMLFNEMNADDDDDYINWTLLIEINQIFLPFKWLNRTQTNRKMKVKMTLMLRLKFFFFEIVFQFNDVFEVTFMLYVFELQVGMK